MKNNLEKKVVKTITDFNLIQDGDKIVLGVSGGPDSICMLDIINKLMKKNNSCKKDKPISKGCHLNPEPLATFGIVVAHINHMIRDEADDDEEFVKNFCEKNNIDFYSKSIDVKKLANNNKIGTEEAGRLARYDFFDEVCKKANCNKIAIAHNKNDKVETIIMNLLRGSGISGLKGIEPKRENYIRPLIECDRSEIEDYCEERNLQPRIDKTNFENIYTRNKVRNIIIPYIKDEFNPNIIDTLDRLSCLVCEQEDYMEEQVKKVFDSIVLKQDENKEVDKDKNKNQNKDENECEDGKEIILDLKQFNKQEKVIKSRLVIYTITRLLGSSQGIEKIHIEDIIKLCSNNIGNKYLTPNKKIKVLVKNHKIYFINQIYFSNQV